MYVAVKGGHAAISASNDLLAQSRRGETSIAALSVRQIEQQLGLLVSRVMAEAGVADRQLAALAIKQSSGDAVEAVFLLRAYRTTLPRFGTASALDTSAMRIKRRVSSIFKDLPGGQILGSSFDYTQRLLDFSLLDEHQTEAESGSSAEMAREAKSERDTPEQPPLSALHALLDEGLIETATANEEDPEPSDITQTPPQYPVDRCTRQQMMARGDEGWLLGMAYSTQRGYSFTHPFAGEIRLGMATVSIAPTELDFEIDIGEIELTECQMINQFVGSAELAPTFTRGYGLTLGHNERKAMAISLIDRAQRVDEFDEEIAAPAQDAEFALAHADSVEASGFVQHLKLPHYVTFESELELIRQLRAEHSVADDSNGREPNE